MTVDLVEALLEAEHRLQSAQLESDVPALTRLLNDELLFTGHGGQLHSKDEDLDAHRSGRQVLHRVEEQELRVLVVGSTGVTWFLGLVEGVVDGQSFAARLRYTRTWSLDQEFGWRVVAAHATVLSAS